MHWQTAYTGARELYYRGIYGHLQPHQQGLPRQLQSHVLRATKGAFHNCGVQIFIFLTREREREMYSSMVTTPEEVTLQLAKQSQAQQEQSKQLRTHSKSIDSLKKILQELLDEVKKKMYRHTISTNRGKNKA